MQKTHLIIGILATSLVGLSLLQKQNAYAFSSIPPVARTGSPADVFTCNSCHSGATPEIVSTGLNTNIPPEGYTPGEEYTINITNDFTRAQKPWYGFQISPQKMDGTLVGTMTSGTGMAVSNDGKYLSHQGPKIGEPGWEFKWKAPEAGTGDFSFYLAVLAANADGKSSGDQVINLALSFKEATTLSSASINSNEAKIWVFNQHLTLKDQAILRVEIYTIQGSLLSYQLAHGEDEFSVAIPQLTPGVYVVKYLTEQGIKKHKFMVP